MINESDLLIKEFRERLLREQKNAFEQINKCDELKKIVTEKINKITLILNKLDELEEIKPRGLD